MGLRLRFSQRTEHMQLASPARDPFNRTIIPVATLTIEIPDDALATLHRSPKELTQEIRLSAAMLWYTQGRMSHEKAAQFAGVSRITFIDVLAGAKLPAFHVDVDELMAEVKGASNVFQ
jgi:predicted HTH domain antitoxin